MFWIAVPVQHYDISSSNTAFSAPIKLSHHFAHFQHDRTGMKNCVQRLFLLETKERSQGHKTIICAILLLGRRRFSHCHFCNFTISKRAWQARERWRRTQIWMRIKIKCQSHKIISSDSYLLATPFFLLWLGTHLNVHIVALTNLVALLRWCKLPSFQLKLPRLHFSNWSDHEFRTRAVALEHLRHEQH